MRRKNIKSNENLGRKIVFGQARGAETKVICPIFSYDKTRFHDG